MTRDISNQDDIIDSRAVIERIEELEEELADYLEESTEDPNEWEYHEELFDLKLLAAQCEGYGDWAHGETLIRDSYFEEYARQLAEDIGAIGKDTAWPCTCIDWEQACKELKHDYMEVDFDGVEYWMRA